MKRIYYFVLMGMLVVSFLSGCGSNENESPIILTPEMVIIETAVSQEIQSEDLEEVVFEDEPEAQPAVDEDKMPVGKCIFCGERAVYVSGAWCCQTCPSVYGDEDILAANLEEWIYIGEYMDCEVYEPNLEIAKDDDGKYIVQIGIFRLAAFSDGTGELTEEGLCFTATDPAGNPIHGTITVEGGTATVNFTDSTWEYLKNGTLLQYIKISEVANIWE